MPVAAAKLGEAGELNKLGGRAIHTNTQQHAVFYEVVAANRLSHTTHAVRAGALAAASPV